jgi:hypothetical protein
VHARRKFDEAVKSLRANERKATSAKETVALQALRQIAALCAIERTLAEATPNERLRVRGERSRPLIEALRRWLIDVLPRVAPQTLTGKALAYLEHRWPKLVSSSAARTGSSPTPSAALRRAQTSTA